MRIHNAFRFGLFGALGVLVALVIGAAITSLATILTYIGAALFLALGLDPLVTWLEKRGMKRPLAILTVLIGVLAVAYTFRGLRSERWLHTSFRVQSRFTSRLQRPPTNFSVSFRPPNGPSPGKL